MQCGGSWGMWKYLEVALQAADTLVCGRVAEGELCW